MKDNLMPTNADIQTPPSNAQLMKATAISLLIAGIILVTFVLPAEYGIDPTGIGGRFGLTAMAKEVSADPPVTPPAPAKSPGQEIVVKRSAPFRSDTLKVILQPGKGSEIKATMLEGDALVFTWSTEGGPVNFDMHGEPPNAGNTFTSYWKDSGKTSAHGNFVAPFAGSHGWYWGNRGSQPVTVTVTASGFYEDIALR
jgi:hypothetical protein